MPDPSVVETCQRARQRRRRPDGSYYGSPHPVLNAAPGGVEPLELPTMNFAGESTMQHTEPTPYVATAAGGSTADPWASVSTGTPDYSGQATPHSQGIDPGFYRQPAPVPHARTVYEQSQRMLALGKDIAEYATNLQKVDGDEEQVARMRQHAEQLSTYGGGLLDSLFASVQAPAPHVHNVAAGPGPEPMPMPVINYAEAMQERSGRGRPAAAQPASYGGGPEPLVAPCLFGG